MKLDNLFVYFFKSVKPVKTGNWLTVMGLLGLAMVSCDLLGTAPTAWDLSGEARHNVASTDLVDKTIKMAAFYFARCDELLTTARPMVSDVAVVDNVEPAFTLSIETSALDPADGDRIFLYMWIEEDTGANDSFDSGERNCKVVNSSSDSVFAPDSYASFFYCKDQVGKENGWYYHSPSGDQEIEDLTGADLKNEVTFWN